MTINTIVKRVNTLLAGEQLVYSRLEGFLDATIDDINDKLNSTFPTFSELSSDLTFVGDAEYDYIPDKYIRSVVIPGAAYKFYVMDEEGMSTAEQFAYDYEKALFMMMRDYLEQVPEEYQSESKGSTVIHEDYAAFQTPFSFRIW